MNLSGSRGPANRRENAYRAVHAFRAGWMHRRRRPPSADRAGAIGLPEAGAARTPPDPDEGRLHRGPGRPTPRRCEAGRRLFAGPVDFLKGVVAMDGLPPADRAEVCFAGRSNVGKSSLINALTGRKALARASNTPGRTQEINFFTLGDAPLPRRPARLRLRRGAEAGRRALAGAAPRLPRRPARRCAGPSC